MDKKEKEVSESKLKNKKFLDFMYGPVGDDDVIERCSESTILLAQQSMGRKLSDKQKEHIEKFPGLSVSSIMLEKDGTDE
jgi:hypothetical protein